MNGFQSRGRDMSAHESASTTGKKIANWTVGNSIGGGDPADYAARWPAPLRHPGPRRPPCAGTASLRAVRPGGARAAAAPVRARAAAPLTTTSPLVARRLGDDLRRPARSARLGFDANARGCRQIPEALEILRARKRAHDLPHSWCIALGDERVRDEGDIHAMLRLLGPQPHPRHGHPAGGGGGAGSDAANDPAAARRHPQRMRLIDWVALLSPARDRFVAPTGSTSPPPARRTFAHLIARRSHPTRRHPGRAALEEPVGRASAGARPRGDACAPAGVRWTPSPWRICVPAGRRAEAVRRERRAEVDDLRARRRRARREPERRVDRAEDPREARVARARGGSASRPAPRRRERTSASSRARARRRRATRPPSSTARGRREAFVRPDEHHRHVLSQTAGLAPRVAQPVEREELREARADVGVGADASCGGARAGARQSTYWIIESPVATRTRGARRAGSTRRPAATPRPWCGVALTVHRPGRGARIRRVREMVPRGRPAERQRRAPARGTRQTRMRAPRPPRCVRRTSIGAPACTRPVPSRMPICGVGPASAAALAAVAAVTTRAMTRGGLRVCLDTMRWAGGVQYRAIADR